LGELSGGGAPKALAGRMRRHELAARRHGAWCAAAGRDLDSGRPNWIAAPPVAAIFSGL